MLIANLGGVPNGDIISVGGVVPSDEWGNLYLDFVSSGTNTLTVSVSISAIYM